MGSESSSMRGFTLQDPPWTHPSGLTIYPALLQEGRPASVFVYQPDNQDKVDKAAKVRTAPVTEGWRPITAQLLFHVLLLKNESNDVIGGYG